MNNPLKPSPTVQELSSSLDQAPVGSSSTKQPQDLSHSNLTRPQKARVIMQALGLTTKALSGHNPENAPPHNKANPDGPGNPGSDSFSLILQEFASEVNSLKLAPKVSSRTSKHPKPPTKPEPTTTRGHTQSTDDPKAVSVEALSKSLKAEHPMSAAVLLSEEPTDLATRLLQKLDPRRAQRIALLLSCMESDQLKIPETAVWKIKSARRG